MANIGILGGTFDPIHLGHTEPAKRVADYLCLDKVLFIPACIPVHKGTPNVSAAQRTQMVTLACSHENNFYCDQREIERTGHSYTVDTLTSLKQSYPEHRLFFIIGLDSLLTFTTWHRYQHILTLCHVVVNSRPNYQLTNLNDDTKALLAQHQLSDLSVLQEKTCGAIIFVDDTTPLNGRTQLNISSTDIRARLANNENCQHLLAEKVLAFINKNQLYR